MDFRLERNNDLPRSARRRPSPTRRRGRPSIEVLEGRVVLSQIMWNTTTAPTGGDFDTATNWVGNVIPGPNDDAVINLTGSGGTVTHNAGASDTIHSLTTNTATSLGLGGGTLSITTASTIGGGFTMTGGTLTGAGTLTVTGGFSWINGTMSGTGTTVLDGSSAFGTTGTAASYETLSGRTLNVFGAATVGYNPSYGGNGFVLSGGATLDVEAGAGLSFITDTGIGVSGTNPGTFIVAGTLAKSAGTATSVVSVPLTDTGAVNVSTGVLSLQASTSTFSAVATLSASSGAALAFDAGTSDLAGGATLSGAGTVAIRGGTVSIDGSVSDSATTTSLTGGTLGGSGTLTVTGGFSWINGTMSGTGTTVLDGSSAFGTTGTAASYETLSGRTLNVFGAATVAFNPSYGGNGFVLSGGATLDVEAGSGLSFISDTGIGVGGSNPGTFIVAGTLAKTAGTGASVITAPLTDTGAIGVSTGTISFQATAGFSAAVTLSASANAALAFDAGTSDLAGGATLSGAGSVLIRGGTVSIDGSVSDSATTTTLTGGTLTGAGTLTVTGGFSWINGTMSGTGTTVLDGSSAFGTTGTAASYETLSGRTLNVFGAATVGYNPSYGGNGFVLSGGATLDVEAGASLSFISDTGIGVSGTNPGTFIVAGTLAKSAGTATSVITAPLTDTGAVSVSTGVLSLQASTSTFSAVATLSASSGAALAFDAGTSDLAGGATLSGAGSVLIRGGTVSIDGSVSDSATTTTLTGGTLTGAGTLTVTGGFSWINGTMSGTGTTVLDGSSAFGTTGTAASYETLSGRTLNVFGAATVGYNPSYGGNGFVLSGGATLDVESGGTLSFITDTGIGVSGTNPGTFIVAGTLAKTAGTGTSVVSVAISDSGVISAATGVLSLRGGGMVSGSSTFSASAGADLDFNGGTFTAPAGSSIGGGGTGTISVGSGLVSVAGTYAVAGATSIYGGELDFNSTASTGSLTQTGGTLGGSGTLTVSGATTWYGGAMSGTGTTVLDGSSAFGTTGTAASYETLSGRTLNVFGAATVGYNPSYGGNGFLLSGGATLDVEAGAGLSFITDTGIGVSGTNPGTFIVAGTLAKSAGTATSVVSVPLTDTGAVNVSTGVLSLQASTSTFSAAATLSASANAALAFDAGTSDLAGGATLSGAGSVLIRGGTVSIDGSVSDSATTTSLTGGTLTGAGTLTVTGGFNWINGTMSGSGTTVLDGSSAFGTTGNAASTESLSGRTLNVFGAATVGYNPSYGGNGFLLSGGATLDVEVGGTLSFITDTGIGVSGTNPGTLVVAGTLAKSAGTGTSIVSVPLSNSGTIQATTGTLDLTGSFSNFSGTTLTGGSYVVTGILMFTGANIVTDAASIVLMGTGSSIVNTSSVNALAGLTSITSSGNFSILGGRNFTTAGAFANAGGLTVGLGDTFTSSGAYTQSGGATVLAGGTLASGSGVTLNGGSLNGVGTVSANVANTSGTVNPGGSGAIGKLTVTGNYTQGSGGTLNLELGGAASGQYDLLAVSGTASLGGTLNVSLFGGYAPGLADSLTPLTFGTRTGDFATQNYPALGGGATLTHVYLSTALQLGVTADVTSQTQVTLGGLLYNRRTGLFTEAVTITNTGSAAIMGPISLVLDNLAGASVVGASGTTSEVGQAGSSYVNVALTGSSLGVGQSVTFYLTFSDPSFAAISYIPRVLAGGGSR